MRGFLVMRIIGLVLGLSLFLSHAMAAPPPGPVPGALGTEVPHPKGSSSASSEVSRYLVEKLKCDQPEDFDLSRRFARLVADFGKDPLKTDEGRQLIADVFFDPESAPSLEQILQAVMKTDYSNALLLAEAGVGKSFLLDQIVGMFSYGILPDYFKKQIAFPTDENLPYAKILKSLIGNSDIYRVTNALLTKQNPKRGEPAPSEEMRMLKVFADLFSAAKKEYARTDGNGKRIGRRSFFVFDEYASLKPYIKEALKTIQDETGFRLPYQPVSRKPDPGFVTISMTTFSEYQRSRGADSAIDRRNKVIKIPETSENSAFRIVRARASKVWEPLYGISVTDDSIRYLIHSRKFLTSPPLAMPGSILAAVNELMTWKLTHPEENPYEGGLKEAQIYLTHKAGLTDVWLTGPNGEPPLRDLYARVSKLVVTKDNALEKISQRLATYTRLEPNSPIPVFIILGPTGSGKDTRFEALNQVLYGHKGKKFNFSIAGVKGFGIDALTVGPPLGNHSDGELGMLLKAMDSGVASAVALNEAADAPSEELEKLKVLFEKGEIQPNGLDNRARTLRDPWFMMGQWGEEIYEGLNDEEKMAKYHSLTQADIENFLLKGRDNGQYGAVPIALIERAKRSGGIYALPPVLSSDFPAVIQTWMPGIYEDLSRNNDISAEVSPQLIQYISRTATKMAHGTRGLSAVTTDFIKGAISKAMDDGLPRNHIMVLVGHEHDVATHKDYIIVENLEAPDKKWRFTPEELYRHKFTCSQEMVQANTPREELIRAMQVPVARANGTANGSTNGATNSSSNGHTNGSANGSYNGNGQPKNTTSIPGK